MATEAEFRHAYNRAFPPRSRKSPGSWRGAPRTARHARGFGTARPLASFSTRIARRARSGVAPAPP